ncbi:MAG: DUF370 domain-containing protein [Andreesenia angusta]|nr:DUF370 domain-containing protein [Andreesenia angusta]
MYIHIGKNCAIPEENIIAIIDKKNMYNSDINKEFLNIASDEGFVENLAEKKEIKSYIITEEMSKYSKKNYMKTKIYASNISSTTLMKRVNYNIF